MGANRLTRRFTAWIACVAMLVAALAPSMSHALATAKSPGSFWTEICSVAGIKFVKVDDGRASDPASPAKPGMAFADCPYCLAHADCAGLPPASDLAPLVASASSSHPSLFYQSPHPLFVWAAPQSRAPPIRS